MIIDNPIVTGSINVQNAVTASNISIASTASAAYFTGSFIGDGTQLSGVTSYTDADTLDFIQGYSGSYSGSFVGDGSQLSGVTSYTDTDTLDFINSISVLSGSIAELTAVTASFLNTGSVTIPHSFNSKNVSVAVYDDSDILIIPQEIALISNNAVKITFGGSTSGFAVVAKGGHIVSGSVPVPQLSTVTDSFTSATTHTVTHNFNTKEVIVSVYEGDTFIIPDSITTDDVNNVTVTFPEPVTGRVVVVKAGHIVSGSIPFNNLLSSPFEQGTLAVTASKHIVPSQDQTYDLGSPTLRFRDLYLSSASIFLGNTVISEDNVVTTASLTSVLPDNVVSSSAQIASDISGSFTSVSASLASDISLNASSINSLNAASSSYATINFVTSSYLPLSGGNITGNFTVDTNTLFVDATSNKIGVKTSNINAAVDFQVEGVIASSGVGSKVYTDILENWGNVLTLNSAGGLPTVFQTNGAERMRITSGGNVGIGTSNPLYQLDVTGTSRFGERLQVRGGGAGTTEGGILINYVGNVNSRSWLLNNDYSTFGDFAILQSTSQTGSTYTNPFYISNNGNVGIGTSIPLLKLDVNGSSFFRQDIRVGADAAGPNTAVIKWNSESFPNPDAIGIYTWADAKNIQIGGLATIFRVEDFSATERARIDNDGLKFNGDTAAANALDDYEEGTFTPAYVGSLGGEIAGYADQGGAYIKIGKLVIVTISLSAQRGTISGNISISGLPFANTGLNWVNMTARRRWATDFQLAGQLNSSATVELYKVKPNETNPLAITRDDMSPATNTFVNTITTTFSYITA